jgi:hypothetical protein
MPFRLLSRLLAKFGLRCLLRNVSWRSGSVLLGEIERPSKLTGLKNSQP